MSKLIRTLTLLVCMALLMSNLPVKLLQNAYAFASEIPEMEMAPLPEPVDTAEEEPQPTSEDEILPAADVVEMTVEEIPVEENTEIISEPAEEIPADETPAFNQGYALVESAAVVYAGSDSGVEAAKIGAGVVYVFSCTDESGRFEIAFNAGEETGIDSGWIDAACARPLDAAFELPSYLESCAGDDGVLYLNNRSDLPLRAISCEYPAPKAEEVPTATQVPAEEEQLVEVELDSMLSEEPETETEEAKILSLRKTSMTLGKGEVFNIADLFLTAPEDADISYTLKTSSKTYVAVNNTDGTIKGVKNGGSATITITPENGQTALKVKVTVKSAATKITLKPVSLTLVEGTTGKLTVGFNSSNYYGQHSFESDNEAVATVDENGNVAAYAEGTARITASLASDPSKTASSEITVLPVPARIAASVGSIMLNQGQQSKAFYGKLPDDLAAIYKDASGKAIVPCNYIYTSSNPEIASVDPETGVITANNSGLVGEAIITAAAHNNPAAIASCTVQVVSVSLAASTMNLGKGETFDMNDLIQVQPEGLDVGFSFKTSNKKYVSVNAGGVIGGVTAAQNATVTITPDNGLPAMKVKVYVRKAATKVSLKHNGEVVDYLNVGYMMSEKLDVAFDSASHYGQYTITSSNPDVVSVDENGNVYGRQAKGSAYITVELTKYDGTAEPVKYSTLVNVLQAPDSIYITGEAKKLGFGQSTDTFYAYIDNYNGNAHLRPCEFIYSVSDETLATVDPQTGVVTANNNGKTGTVSIIAAAHNNPKATSSIDVRIVPDPDSIAAKATTVKLGQGEMFDITTRLFELTPSSEYCSVGYTAKISSTKYVTMETDGFNVFVYGKKAGGSANITITPHNGLDPITVKVMVYKKPSAITLSPTELTLVEGMSGKVNVSYPSGTYAQYDLVPAYSSVADVDIFGNITAKKAGSQQIGVFVSSVPNLEKSMTLTVLPAPDRIQGSIDSLKLGNGQVSSEFYGSLPQDLAAAYVDANGKAVVPCNFIYTSSNPEIAAVDAATGKITANNSGLTGTATITVSASNNPNASAACTVEVVPDPDTITLQQTTLKIAKGEIFDIKTLLKLDPVESAAGYTFKTSNKSIVTVNAAGLVKGVKNGSSATITITPHNGLPALKVKVTVYKKPTSITLSPAEITLGQQMQDKLSVSFKSGYSGTYTLTSDNPEVVSVGVDGTITSHASGSAVITATLNCDPSVQDSATVIVEPAPEFISASVAALKLGRGQTSMDLYGVADTMCHFLYESDRPEIVAVDASTGKLTAAAIGTANITISAHNNAAASVTVPVTVMEAPTGASLKQASLTIGVGNTYDVRELVELSPADSAAGYSLKTSSKSYVSVDANGTIKGVKAGSATITITTHNGVPAGKLKVTVKKAPASYPLSLSANEIGMQMPAKATVKFASGYTSLYEIVSSNPEVATVDADGSITPVAPGTTSIIVRNPDGSDKPKAASAELTVYAAPEKLEVNYPALKLSAGQTFSDLQAVSPEGTMCNFIFSSDSAILTVDEATGKISVSETAMVGETAGITVTAHNNPAAQAVCAVEIVKQPTYAELTQTSLTIGVGDKFDVKTLVSLEEGSAASYTYTTSNKTYATVDANGIVKGMKAGSYSNIKITTHNGVYVGTVKVNVKNAPGSIYLDPAEITLGVGMQAKLNASFASSSYYSLYTITSSDPVVASVDDEGKVKALSEGSVEITAATQNGKQDSTIVHVLAAPSSVEFIHAEAEVAETMQVNLSDWVQVNEGAMGSYTFTSSNPEVASIEGGILTALRGGQTEISVGTHNGVKNTVNCVVTVVPAPNKLDFNGLPPLVVAKGDTVVLPEPIATDAYGDECPTTFRYEFNASGFSAYAQLDGRKLTGIKAGTVVVRVTSHNGVSTTLTVKVDAQPITGLYLDSTENTLFFNENLNYADEMELHASFVSAGSINSGSLSYASSDPSIVSVEEIKREDGNVYARLTAVSAGEAEITVTAFNDVSAVCKISVKRLTTTLGFAENSIMITEGKTCQLQPVFDEGASAELTYATSDPSIAVVDETSGFVMAVKPGTAVISASTQTGVSASVNVKVIAGPTGVSLDACGISLKVGESITLKPEIHANTEEVDRSVSFASSNADVVSVDESGNVIALVPGDALITIETCNGHRAECSVHVVNEGENATVGFAWTNATMVKGDTAKLEFTLNKAAYENGFTIVSSDPAALEVNEADWTIRAKAASAQGVSLTLTVHSGEGEVGSLAEEVSCNVVIVSSITPVFSASKVTVRVYNELKPENARAELVLSGIPEDLIGTYKLYVEDEALASYDPVLGVVSSVSELIGETRVVCEVYGATASCLVEVLADPTYRAVIIAEYNKSSQTGSNLPFANNNVKSVRTTLKNSYIDGKTYEQITYLSSNPTQAQIQSAIETTFADAKEGDVSLIYIVSHGYYTADRGYYFGTPNWSWAKQDTVITSGELLEWMSPIEGNVVLLLDSCKSGGFIRDTSADLAAEGNIAVLTAQTYDRNASYFQGKTEATQVEFMTYVLCQGLGYEYDIQSWVDLKADSNKDGAVSVNELFGYTQKQVPKLVVQKGETEGYLEKGYVKIPGVKNWADYYEWGGQYPQTFIPDSMKNLVIYGR